MLLSTTIGVIQQKVGDKEAIRIVAEAGFDAYDMSFLHLDNLDEEINAEAYLEEIKALRKYADGLGIACNQAHAPFPTSSGDREKDAECFKRIVISMEAASILGAEIIVVHPKQHLKYAEPQNPAILREMNIEFYNSLIPYCEKFKIKVAVENMWQHNDNYTKCLDSTCSSPEEWCDYIDTLNSEWIVACLDIGHVVIVDRDLPDMVHKLGKRIGALHVHDTDFVNDCHTVPFLEKMDFASFTKALAQVEYKGDFTFEAVYFFNNIPAELLPSAVKFLHDTGRYLIKMINNK